tara:strand:+ start:281 stop:1852 length:1572 start_codon:yes stop_codon:yes gene_type:complete
MTKFIIITGGVLSGLGKGVAAASIGSIISDKYTVVPMKLDGYLNVDPGTMNPFEHGEVFVLEDGGEVDMDFGHYERFLNIDCKIGWNLTMGKVFDEIRLKERRGDYLGKTVQYVPHVTNLIKNKFLEIARDEKADVMLIEVGGTVGDIENELYLEAVRQLRWDIGSENVLYVHLTYVPIPSSVDEQKSKPTQQSVNLLRSRGIQPDIIIGRCSETITKKVKEKIAIFGGMSPNAVISGVDVEDIYDIPRRFMNEGIHDIIMSKLRLEINPRIKLSSNNFSREVNIAICGKYTDLEDSYASVIESIKHATFANKVKYNLKWIETTDIEKGKISVLDAMSGVEGVIVPGGFGIRGSEGKIGIIKYCREKGIPFLGLCYGMQLAVIEFARNVCGFENANSTENDAKTKHPVVHILPNQGGDINLGGTLRLGGHDVSIKRGSRAEKLFGRVARLRFRHRYEINKDYVSGFEKEGLVFSGYTKSKDIMQILEIPEHTFFMATQAHPEFTSRPTAPSPLFLEFISSIVR